MNPKNNRTLFIIGVFVVIIAALNMVGKKQGPAEKIEIADDDSQELNLKMPETPIGQVEAPAPKPAEQTVACQNLHRQACQIENDQWLDDSTGIYDSSTGYNDLGIVDRGQGDDVAAAKAFWEGYSQFSVKKISCAKMLDDHQATLEKYFPSECAAYLKKCKGGESCRVNVEASCLWAAEETFKSKMDDEGDLAVDRFISLNHCRDQYYNQIYDRYYRNRTNEISRIFNEAIVLAHTLIARHFPADAEKFFDRVQTTRLLLGERLTENTRHIYHSEGEILVKNIFDMDNAFFGEAESFNVASLGMSIVHRFHSKAALLFIIGHELGHSFDPQRFAVESCGYRGKSFSENKSLNPLDLPNALSCQGVPHSLQKKAKELLAVLPLHRYQKVSDGQSRETAYLGEIFADWFGTEMVNEYFRQKGLSTLHRRHFVYNIARFLCGNDAHHDDGIHPPWEDRINIFMRHYLDQAEEMYLCPK